MTDIISARCFNCGNVIKVPAGLGGKKARCPQCTNTISIPMAATDTQFNDIISDDELPEVARDGEKVLPEEGDAPIPGQEPEEGENPSDSRRRGSTSVRGRVANSGSSMQRVQPQRGTQARYGGGKGESKSSSGMIIGIALGVVALIILAVVATGNSSSKKEGKAGVKEKEKDKEKESKAPPPPQYSPEDQALVSRLLDYTAAVNRGEAALVLKFYAYDAEEERRYRIRATELVDKKTMYENAKVTSVSVGAGSGTISFAYGAGSTKTLQWKQVDNVWLIAEPPTP